MNPYHSLKSRRYGYEKNVSEKLYSVMPPDLIKERFRRKAWVQAGEKLNALTVVKKSSLNETQKTVTRPAKQLVANRKTHRKVVEKNGELDSTINSVAGITPTTNGQIVDK